MLKKAEAILRKTKNAVDLRGQVAVMFSGGADSVATLHHVRKFLSTVVYRDEPRERKIQVIYLDFERHKYRDENLAFVTALIKQYDDCQLTIIRIDADMFPGVGPEGQAHAAFDYIRRGIEPAYDCIFTGHNRDDHLETILIQLFRGPGRGAQGLPNDHHRKLVRPLITSFKHEVVSYCDMHALNFFEDHDNQDATHTRAFVRHQLMPLLKSHYGIGIFKRIENIGKFFQKIQEVTELVDLDDK